MARLLIQFTTEEIADFRWARFDETMPSGELDWQHAGVGDLTAVATQNPHPVIMVIPQQCVYLTQVELPEKAGRQVLSAIEYQIEDQLAQDIETQHCALGDTSQNPIAIAVVARTIMARCIALARNHDLRLIQVIPELFLCPWQGTGHSLVFRGSVLLMIFWGTSAFSSISAARGLTSFWANSRATSRSIWCSSLKVKSIGCLHF